MTDSKPPETTAASFAAAAKSIDLSALETELRELDLEDLTTRIDELLTSTAPAPEQADDFYALLYRELTNWSISLDFDLDELDDLVNYYRLLPLLLEKNPNLMKGGFHADDETLCMEIDEDHIKALQEYDDSDEEAFLKIIASWKKLALLNIQHQRPVTQFRAVLQDHLKQEFKNPAFKAALSALDAAMGDALSTRVQPSLFAQQGGDTPGGPA